MYNNRKDDSILPMDDIEIVIGSDGNYVEIPFVPDITGTHTIYLNENNFYKFQVIQSETERFRTIIDVNYF